MATVARLEAILTANTRQFDRAMRDSETGMQKAGRGISTAAKIAGAAIAGGLAVAAKIGWDEFRQGQLVAAQTNAVLKSTGGIANVTAKQVDSLAASLMKKSGVDDEAIQSGANMLLTFTKIRNETGRGRDIFNQATKATLDLSVAMGKDMQSSAVLVGKALNDPVRGLTALRRVGVSFTKAQQDQIKSLVESGKTMQAQKMILGELRTEFGGSAEAAGKTLPGQLRILRETFNNLAGDIVGNLVPKLVAVVGFFREHTTITKILAGVIGGLIATLLIAGAAMKVYAAGMAIIRGAVLAWTAVQWLLNAALLANPIGLILIALLALGAAFVVLWKKSETFRDIVIGTWEAIKGAADAVWNFIKDIVGGAIDFMVDLVQKHPLVWLITHFGEVKKAVGDFIGAIPGVIVGFFIDIFNKAAELGGKIKAGAVSGITGIAGRIWDFVKAIWLNWQENVQTIVGWGLSLGGWLKDAVVNGVKGLAGFVWEIVNNIWARFLEGIDIVKGWGAALGGWIKNAIPAAIVGIGAAVWGVVNNIWEFIKDRADAIKEWGKQIGIWLKDAIVDAIKGLPGAIWDILKGIPGAIGDKVGDAWAKAPPTPIPSQGPVGRGRMDINPGLWDELALAQNMELVLTSGYRPGAITSSGRPSKHGVYPSKAIDVAGSAANMARFALAAIQRPGIEDVFYDPLGGRFRIGGHRDHVHVELFDNAMRKLRWLKPGWTLAGNFTGSPEPVGRAAAGNAYITMNVGVGDPREIARRLREVLRVAGFNGIIIDQPQPGFS
jgi:phage-related protein